MVKRKSYWSGGKSPGGLCAVVLHENLALREPAFQFWQEIEKQCAAGRKPEVSWWPLALLDQSAEAQEATARAARADVIVFSLSAGGDLTEGVKLWIETWLGQRGAREGALVGLVEGERGLGGVACLKEIYLRHIAHRAGMDYISHATLTSAQAIPDSLDSFTRRAGQKTSLLDEILRTHPAPPTL